VRALPPGSFVRGTVAIAALALAAGLAAARAELRAAAGDGAGPFLVVLGVAQDGGVPQAGSFAHPAWDDASLARSVVSLGLVDPRAGRRYLFEATPDLRRQLRRLDQLLPRAAGAQPIVDGVFLTHAHMGHYTGLLFFGHEAMGARGVPVHAMPRMAEYLRGNGPWDQLVRYENVRVETLAAGVAVPLASDLAVTPVLVPHRQEYSEVVGFRIDGPRRKVLFVPDINSWTEWDAWGVRVEEQIAAVDVAYLDGCFFDHGEVPGRDMSQFPHPLITDSLRRFAALPPAERAKIRFLHLNHTNPVLDPDGEARRRVEAAGLRIAEEGERVEL
jgi:pyrroloquinoline quinone biosynthesis protein B